MEEITSENKLIEYDANAVQRVEFTVIEAGEKFDTAHIWNALSNERYLKYTNAVKGVVQSDDDTEEKLEEATIALWNDTVKEVENLDLAEGQDFRDVIDRDEKRVSTDDFLSVAVVEPEVVSTGKRRGTLNDAQIITTEALFNGKPVRQTHKLVAKSHELSKKYERIRRKSIKAEPTRGLRVKAKLEFIPQTEAFAALYDEMLIEATGFKLNVIPIRFKVRVVNEIFGGTLDPK